MITTNMKDINKQHKILWTKFKIYAIMNHSKRQIIKILIFKPQFTMTTILNLKKIAN